MILDSYGRASGFCVDPIEKKPLNHFYPGSSVLSFGTAGCNLGCRFCQNWDISKARRDDRLQESAAPVDIVSAAKEAGCKSVAFTYNDPVVFAEFAIDCAAAAREAGLKSVAVTAGYITPLARADFYRHLDAVNVDLKGFSEEFYRKQCYAELGPVLETLQWVHEETNVWLEVTTLLIPGLNDSTRELEAMSDWFVSHLGVDVPWHFTAFHPDFRMRDRERTPLATLRRARTTAIQAGVRHVYTGNAIDPEGQSTFCANCDRPLIERDGYRIGAWHLDANGKCSHCGHQLCGHFEPSPGTWGARRSLLQIARRP